MTSSSGTETSAAGFNSASSLLDDPFSELASMTPSAKSTTSTPALSRKAISVGSTPTRTAYSLANTPTHKAYWQDGGISLLASPSCSGEATTEQDHSANLPGLSTPGGTESADSLATPSPLREDRVGKEVTDENAQGYYGPGQSVFFGNLPMNLTNEVLQQLIKEDLESRIGKCYVSITRDNRNIPIAFVAFTKEEDAQKALGLGSECVIGRRVLRPEAPKGNFVFIVFKNDGTEVSGDEIESLFKGKGPVHQCFTPDSTMRGFFDLPKEAKCVQMGTFGDFRDARKAFQHTLMDINVVPLSKLGRARLFHKSPPRPMVSSRMPLVDALSVFVGNLPLNCSKYEIINLFRSVGPVKSVHLIHAGRIPGALMKPNIAPYAFVEFTDPYAVFEAICAFNNHLFRGQMLRVEFRLQTRMAMQGLQNELQGYIARCLNQHGYQPPMEMIMGFLNARSPMITAPYFQLMRTSPADPICFYVASMMGLQPVY